MTDVYPYDLDTMLGNRGQPIVGRRLGAVAKRVNIPTFTDATVQQLNFRRGFIAMDDMTAPQMAFPNWYVDSTLHEAGSGGTAVFGAAIERLDGTIIPLTWGGSATSPSVANGDNSTLSDATALATPIKRGEWFAVRGHGEFSVAVPYYVLTSSSSSTIGDAFETAASGQTDKTLTGTIGTNSGKSFGPCRIVDYTTRRSWALIGDSNMKGGSSSTNTDVADGTGDLGRFARAIGQFAAYTNMGCGGETLTGFLTGYAKRVALVADHTDVLCNFGVNDLSASRSASTILTDVATFLAIAGISTKRPKWATIPPVTTTSDAWATIANQTVAAWEAQRVTLNNTLRCNKVVGLYGCVDICAAVESAINSGKLTVGLGGQAITGDGIHFFTLGCLMVAASGLLAEERMLA